MLHKIATAIHKVKGRSMENKFFLLRIQDGINPTQDLMYETLVAKMVRSNLLPSTIEQTRFVGAGVG